MTKKRKELIITSPSRLHLGFYGFDDIYGYKYGSMGLAINSNKTVISVKQSKKLISDLPNKYMSPILKFLDSMRIQSRFEINTISKPLSHVGLGSGSQLSLSLGTALCKFLNLKMSVDEIAQIYNRGQRSGTGISIFKNGGFVVDACKKEQLLPEAMFSSKFPKD